MDDLNVVAIVGRLTADPELRSLASGTSVCSLRVAFNTSKKNPQTGQWEDVGNFINVNVWAGQAETAAKYLSKGRRVAINGRLEHRTWQDKDGNNRSTIEVVANRVQFLESNDSGQTQSTQTSSQQAAPSPADDDIPF